MPQADEPTTLEAFPDRSQGVPAELWAYYRHRHGVAGYDAVAAFLRAVEEFNAGCHVTEDGGCCWENPSAA